MLTDPMTIRQKRPDWCIPAAVEYVGKKTGLFPRLSQDDLYKAGIRGTFGPIPKALGSITNDAEAEHVDTVDFEDWKTKVEKYHDAGDSVVISIPNDVPSDQTWHMRVVLDYDESAIRVFDPAKGEDTVPWSLVEDRRSKYCGGTDLLLIRRK